MKKISFVVLSFYCMNLALSQDAYICIPTARTGFSVNPSTKKWEQTRFRIDDDKKILKKNNDKWGNPPNRPKAREVEFSLKEFLREEVKIYRQPDHGCPQTC